MKMYQLIWRYECNSSEQEEFESTYQRNGKWFHFYEQSDDFLGLELVKQVDKNDYLVIDSWVSKEAYDEFMNMHKSAYDQLNDQCTKLHSKEEFLGFFETVG